jgi:serine/threonine-protein kinase HipA
VSALRELRVFSASTLVGTLYRSDRLDGDYLFSYEEKCSPEHAVSLTMPIRREPYDSMNTVHPIFEMNLPEGALLERLRLLFAKTIDDFDDLALLSILGGSQIGRLRYAPTGKPLQDVPAQNLKSLLAQRGSEDLFESLLAEYAAYSGISGVQPKVLLRDAAAGTLERTTVRGATHIVKAFDPKVFYELAANEYFCLRAAALAGLPVAKAELSADRRLLAVERFDISASGEYLGFEDFCVLSGIRPDGRYSGSYETLMTRIGQFVSPGELPSATEVFFTLVALNCALENGDAHLKNFSVLYENPERTVRLAPAYDILSTTPYRPRDSLALSLGESKAFPERAVLVKFGRTACGLPPRLVHELLGRVSRGVRGAIEEMRQYAKEHPDFEKAAKHLEATFTRALARSIEGTVTNPLLLGSSP